MLTDLKVTNFAIIDRLDISFKNGLNVISGETGSGKSVLLRAISLMMGEKSHTDAIKNGESQATVEAGFDLADRKDIKSRLIATGYADAENTDTVEDMMVVRRTFSADGKNRVFINGRLATLAQLREIVAPLIEVTGQPAPLIEITGQHENRNLQSKMYHLEMLDHYLGLMPLRHEVESFYSSVTDLNLRIKELEDGLRTRSQRLDFLTYQRDEIQALNPQLGEDQELLIQVQRARESAKYNEFIAQAEAALYGDEDSALVRLHRVLQKGSELARTDSDLARLLEPLSTAQTHIEEALYSLREHGRGLHLDPEDLNSKEERLSQIRKLQKKFGPALEDVLQHFTEFEEEIRQLETSDAEIATLKTKLSEAQKLLLDKARQLHKKRMKGSETLVQSVNSELADLNMKGLLFSVQIRELTEVAAHGLTDLEFSIQNSKTDTPRSLSKFASGGELSRILLALKRVVGNSELPRTYIFDEVDAGVSGVTAEKVGRKLKSIAKGQQVISVTHLPQVAAFADIHFTIQKKSTKTGSMMHMEELNKDSRVKEIARMLSGEKITAASLANARELMKR